MSEKFTFTIDGVEVQAQEGETILQAAGRNGIYIPHLCAMKGLEPHGSCRVCTVLIAGRPQAACTQPAAPGLVVDNSSERLMRFRKNLIEMLFVEGNHFCPVCEKSGNCELQALAYRFGITAPKYPYQFPIRHIDMSHPDVFIDRNRCILCARCIRASRDIDGKHVFDFVGRGHRRHVAVDGGERLCETKLAVTDKAAEVCPVGAIVKKRVGYAIPIGKRLYDRVPIGSDIESLQKPL